MDHNDDNNSDDDDRKMNDTTMPPPQQRLLPSVSSKINATTSTTTTTANTNTNTTTANTTTNNTTSTMMQQQQPQTSNGSSSTTTNNTIIKVRKKERGKFSLSDWTRYISKIKVSTNTPIPTTNKVWTYYDVSLHNKKYDGYIILHNKVYNISSFLLYHPGGSMIIEKYLGTDITSLYHHYHHWVNEVPLLQPLYIGIIDTQSSKKFHMTNNNNNENDDDDDTDDDDHVTTDLSKFMLPPSTIMK